MQEGVQRIARNTLLNRFDADPGPWRPMYYPVEIDVPVESGGSEERSVTINNQPFIWQFLGHQIMGCTGDPITTGLFQDGQYDITMRDEQSNYQSGPIAVCASIGGGPTGYMIYLPLPIPYPGTKTLTFRVTNRCTRRLSPESDVFTVKLTVGGVADWGELR
jgi:hypothetical protein